ncbi:hypothetical protein GCM10028798_09830 [Humibacter antri]
MSNDQPIIPSNSRPTIAQGVTHSAVEDLESVYEDDVRRGESESRRAARQRAHARLRADVPEHLAPTAHLGVGRDGSVTQTFSAAASDDCGCGKPADFSSIQKPTRVEMTMRSYNRAPQTPPAVGSHLPGPRGGRSTTPPAPSGGSDAAHGARGGRTSDDLARSLASRVHLTRGRFAASSATPLVLFDQAGQVIGTTDPAKVQQPGKGEQFAFDQNGQILGIVADGDITQVQQPAAPADDEQQEQPLQNVQVGDALASKLAPGQRWW